MPVSPLCPQKPARCTLPAKISLPFGLELQAPPTHPMRHDDPCECLFRLAGPSGAALAGLTPMLVTVDASLAIASVLDAIPEGLVTLNPAQIIEKLREAAEKIAKMAQLAPVLAIPAMLLSLLDYMIRLLDCIILRLREIEDLFAGLQVRLDFAIARENYELVDIIECAKDDATRLLQNVLGAYGALGPLVGMLNQLLGMIPGGASLSFETPAPSLGIGPIVTALEGFRDTLRGVRALIPA